MSAAPETTRDGPRALLRARDAVAIIVGIVIGAGIYRTPPLVAGATADAGWMLSTWIAGALVSLVGALCYAELASAYPHTGGDYHFLTRAFGRNTSFLYAWARAIVINAGSIALLAFVFGDYASRLLPLDAAWWAATIVVALTLVNLASLAASARTQNWLTIVEVLGLVVVCAAGVLAPPVAATARGSPRPAIGALGLAMVFVLLTYGGWSEAAYLSAGVARRASRDRRDARREHRDHRGAVRRDQRGAPRGAGPRGPRAEQGRARRPRRARAFGRAAGDALAGFVAVATLTSINATMLVGARTNYALSGDWASLRVIGGWDAARGVPARALLVQCAIALALVAFGAAQKDGFEAMVEFTAPVFWGFLTLVGVALFVLRARDRDRPRPFKVPLYPLTPVVFIAACAYLCWSSIAYAASRSATHVSLIVMAAGVVALVLVRYRAR